VGSKYCTFEPQGDGLQMTVHKQTPPSGAGFWEVDKTYTLKEREGHIAPPDPGIPGIPFIATPTAEQKGIEVNGRQFLRTHDILWELDSSTNKWGLNGGWSGE
jgi:hypothetical protein